LEGWEGKLLRTFLDESVTQLPSGMNFNPASRIYTLESGLKLEPGNYQVDVKSFNMDGKTSSPASIAVLVQAASCV
jgi:hypothetical protein